MNASTIRLRGSKRSMLLLVMVVSKPLVNYEYDHQAMQSVLASLLGKQQHQADNHDCPQEPCGLSLIFMGDSLLRFQYFSLVYFLRHGNWLDPAAVPSFLQPKNFPGGWMPWFNASMNALMPNENCDCYREAVGLHFSCENRYYYDPIRNNRVTFLTAVGNASPLHGHWKANRVSQQLAAYHQQTGNRSMSSMIGDMVGPMKERIPYLWEGTWMDVIHTHVQELQPKVLVMNAGKWPHLFDKPDYLQAIQEALSETSIPRVLWKTTTANRGGRYTTEVTDSLLCNTAPFECMNTTWTVSVPNTLYMDKLHFNKPVYRLLNEQLLVQLDIALPSHLSLLSAIHDSDHSKAAKPDWYPSIPIPASTK